MQDHYDSTKKTKESHKSKLRGQQIRISRKVYSLTKTTVSNTLRPSSDYKTCNLLGLRAPRGVAHLWRRLERKDKHYGNGHALRWLGVFCLRIRQFQLVYHLFLSSRENFTFVSCIQTHLCLILMEICTERRLGIQPGWEMQIPPKNQQNYIHIYIYVLFLQEKFPSRNKKKQSLI